MLARLTPYHGFLGHNRVPNQLLKQHRHFDQQPEYSPLEYYSWMKRNERILAQTIHASRRYDGPMGKSDRAFIFGAIAFFIGIFPSLTLSENTHYLFIIINLLLLLTCYHRIHRTTRIFSIGIL